MSRKKAMRNELRKLNREISIGPMRDEIGRVALTHVLWSLPPEEMKSKLVNAGSQLTIRIVGVLGAPELAMEFAIQDALMIIDEDPDDDMIDFVADRYHELTEPLFPEGQIVTLAIDRKDGSGADIVLIIRPEDYTEQSPDE